MSSLRRMKGTTMAVAAALALVLAAAGATAVARVGPVLGGGTSQSYPIVFELNASKTKILKFRGAIVVECSDGSERVLYEIVNRIPIRRSGAFKDVFRQTITNEGVQQDWNDVVSGQFNPRRTRVSGTWRLRFISHEPGGDVSCDSGAVTYRARH